MLKLLYEHLHLFIICFAVIVFNDVILYCCPTLQKVNQAQKILKRAKSQNSKSPPVKSKGKRKGSTNESAKNTKKKSESSDNDTSQPRRSSRSSARVAAMAISTSFEVLLISKLIFFERICIVFHVSEIFRL